MKYMSTRSGNATQTFGETLLAGLAEDGGLAVCEHYPQLDSTTLQAWQGLSYVALAQKVISCYATDIPTADLNRLIALAYLPERFGSSDITPVTQLQSPTAAHGGLYLLELSNGPTLAFKDIAMQLLGQLFEYQLARSGRSLNILGATSGDTGSAAEYAMRGKKGIQVFMLSPKGKMSAFQRAQMYSLQDPNIFNIAVAGFFDDAQDIVKAVSEDLPFKLKYSIGTVNSINWARVCAQVVYYFKAYFAVAKSLGDPVTFVVPSGNFGNVLAGHIARQMGLPIHRLVVATNENNVLDEFFKTGVYRPRLSAQTYETSSPSMDISKASNFERFVFDLLGRDAQALSHLWRSLQQQGMFDMATHPAFAHLSQQFGFASGRSTHADRLATMRNTYRDFGRIIDPHTADAMKVAHDHFEAGVPTVVLETALPIKFAATVQEALGFEPPRPAAFADIEQRPQRVVELPTSVAEVQAFIAEHATP